MCAAFRYAATFQNGVEELVDVGEVSEEDKNKPQWLFGFKEEQGRKHRLVRAVKGERKCQCMRCGMRSLNHRVPGVCKPLKWVQEHQARGQNTYHVGRMSLWEGIQVRQVRKRRDARLSLSAQKVGTGLSSWKKKCRNEGIYVQGR